MMTRPDISTLVDKNGVRYELEGKIVANKVIKCGISAFKYDHYGWKVLAGNGEEYKAEMCEYIRTGRTLDEIKHSFLDSVDDVLNVIDEAYELGKAYK